MIKLITSKLNGLCPGVKNAVSLAKKNADGGNTYCLGAISHNEHIIESLTKNGIQFIDTIDQIIDTPNTKVIIRSHGTTKKIHQDLKAKNFQIIDATCSKVASVHKIVSEFDAKDYQIIILGDKDHPEVIGTAGHCTHPIIISSLDDIDNQICILKLLKKACIVSQTTFLKQKAAEFIEKIKKIHIKTLEVFDTICYTTAVSQFLAEKVAEKSDLTIVVGSKFSSNTNKLFVVASNICPSFLVSDISEMQKIAVYAKDKASPAKLLNIGLLAGASTPKELITEVINYMSKNIGQVKVSEELSKGVEESLTSYREGRRVKGTVILADETGVRLNFGGKNDGIIHAEEMGIDIEYNPENYPVGLEIEAIITGKKDSDTQCIPLSKRKLDLIKEGDKVVETIREGQAFEILCQGVAAKDSGLVGKLGNYSVFVPKSQILERGFPKDLKSFVKKKMRLTALEIDDDKQKIVASQKKILSEERAEKESIFWMHVKEGVIINGTVKRITKFGAFVSVDGFDCLVHITDVSWKRIKDASEVLEIEKAYDFVVLSTDKEKGRVALGYKQLQPHPQSVALAKHPVGSISKGKVVSLVPFGAFVQIEPGLEGLVHVSEAAHDFVKDIHQVVKVGDEVDVMVLAIDEASRKITLSMKACLPESGEEITDNASDKKPREKKAGTAQNDKQEWSEDNSNNPFANLLKNVDVDK
ncbi:MAG: 4-hydroxy-3-methylbut-2-enyl diphosphate reductase [Firmicutes bacterium]|nr:4-hydroxy-3-methylbut-2-enyl diphosphate reductase [Bacillota bacterium]